MILKFFYIFYAVFALKSETQLFKRDSGTFLDHQNKNVSFLEPKFNENCDEISLEAASECENDLKTILDKCLEKCTEQQSCIGQCQRDFFISLDQCPCHAECPEGCKDCPHWTCSHPCDEATNYSETEKCYKKNADQFNECNIACDIDFVCVNNCYLELAENNKLCPCGEKCPQGCPCIDCPECWSCEADPECKDIFANEKCISMMNEKLKTCVDNCHTEEEMYFMRQNARKGHPKLSMWQKL